MNDSNGLVPLVGREPARGTYLPAEDFELPGLERLRCLIKRPTAPPFGHFSGLRFTDAGIGSATVAMPASPWWQTRSGVFSAGTLAFVADAALGGAVNSVAGERTIVSTSEISLNFLRPVTTRSETIIGRGRVLHSTRTLGLSEVFLEDGRGRVLGHGTSRCVLIRIDPDELVANRPAIEPPPPDFQGFWQRPVEGEVREQEYWNETTGAQAMLDRTKPNGQVGPQAVMTGQSLVAASEGEATIAVPASAWFSTGNGTIYGGLLAYLADMATNHAVSTTLPAATVFSPLDLKVNFLRPALPGNGQITARARRIHVGRRIAVYTIEVSNSAGKLIAIANESVLILPGRSWDEPVVVADEPSLDG